MEAETINVMKIILNLLLGLCLVTVLSSHLLAQSNFTLLDEVKLISPQINQIFICGEWKFKEKAGVFRIISGWIYGHSELYIQWLNRPYGDKIMTVDKTLSISEFNYYNSATDLSNIRCKVVDNGIKLEMSAFNWHSETNHDVSILLFNEPGKYQLFGFNQ